MTHLINLTFHPIDLYDTDDRRIAHFPSTPQPARIHEHHSPAPPLTHNRITIPAPTSPTATPPKTSPPQPPHTHLIVSRIIAFAHSHRTDLVFPLDEVNPRGRIIGCRGFGTANTDRNPMTSTRTTRARNPRKRLSARNHVTAAHSRCLSRVRPDKDRNRARRDEVLAECYIHAGHIHRQSVPFLQPDDRA